MSNQTFGDYFALPNSGLRAYFGRVRSGQPEIYRTNFYGQETDPQSILAEWDKVLVRISEKLPSLYEFESDLRAKVGPMSVMQPLSERMDDISSYYESILLDSEPISTRAIQSVIDEFNSVRGLRLRSKRRVWEKMKKSTNSGAPYFTKRRRLDDVITDWSIDKLGSASFQYGPDIQTREDVWYWLCAVLGWRGQEGGPLPTDVKQRVVWMFPAVLNMYELMCYQVLIEASQAIGQNPAWVGMDAVDSKITQLFAHKHRNDLVVCTDFSKFDQHYNSDMQAASLSILDGVFTREPEYEFWRSQIYPLKYNIPLAYDWDKIRFGPHGMGSGSGGTNGDESIGHRALQHEAAQANGESLTEGSQDLGDDGVLSFPHISVDKVVQSYSRHGLEMNPDKQYASTTDCVYLRRWHSSAYKVNDICVGVYSTFRALGRMCYQERFYDHTMWGPKAVALRQLSIIENCKYHPLREEFAEFCMKGDRYRLGIDIPGFLDSIEREAEKLIALMPDFIGYTKSQVNEAAGLSPAHGIKDWWIVQFLKSKL